LYFRVPNNLEKETQSLKITGDIPQMGNFAICYDMKLVYKKQKNSDAKEQYWEVEFMVDPLEKEINYCYFSYDKENQIRIYERKRLRRVNLEFSALNELVADKTKRTSKYSILKNDRYKIYDLEFQNKFLFNEINKNIIVGSFIFLWKYSCI